ncbi:MAG: HEAT repeat domain-containing protein [Gemmatimonadetes bacterium]|nr:HEAT repeat domain-containing protein [Gemmatimonadota bacterium]
MTDGASTDLALPPALIEELLQALAKALRAHQLYLPNNPVYQKAIETLRQAFQPIWEATDDLVLDVAEGDLRWEGNVVYSSTSRGESIAWVFFKDGVRSVTLLPGVERDEIVGLLDVVHRARSMQSEDSDDLLTLLWEKDFQRIRYVFQDLTSDAGAMTLPTAEEVRAPATMPGDVAGAVAEEVGEPGMRTGGAAEEEAAPSRAGIVRAEDFDTTLYFLDEKEIEYIKGAVQNEYAQDLRRNVLAMLFDVLELQPYPTVRAELISILESFLPYLLGAADFTSVAYVLREAKAVVTRARELLPEHRKALEDLPLRLSQEQTLAQLLQSLDEATVQPSAEELGELFHELRGEALPTLFAWLPKLANARVREVLDAAVTRLAAANTQMVVLAMQSADPSVVLEAVKLSAKLKLQQSVAALGQALGHVEPAIRVAGVHALAEIASPAALQALERGLEDADREVRLASIRVIGVNQSKSALAKISEVVQGKSVRERDLTEKMAFFEAYGTLVGESGVAGLDAILSSGGFLKRKEDAQTRACAAMALGKIGTPSARQALEKAAADKEPLVRNAVSRALRGERATQSMFVPPGV